MIRYDKNIIYCRGRVFWHLICQPRSKFEHSPSPSAAIGRDVLTIQNIAPSTRVWCNKLLFLGIFKVNKVKRWILGILNSQRIWGIFDKIHQQLRRSGGYIARNTSKLLMGSWNRNFRPCTSGLTCDLRSSLQIMAKGVHVIKSNFLDWS